METNKKEDEKSFQPQNGDFVRLISGKLEYEAIFKCLNNNQIWSYAIISLNNDWYRFYTDWSANEFEILHSDGSHVLAALKKAGKKWNAEKKWVKVHYLPFSPVYWRLFPAVSVLSTETLLHKVAGQGSPLFFVVG